MNGSENNQDSWFKINLGELPIIAAGLVLLLGVLFWYRAQNIQTASLNSTHQTLAALQAALVQYEQTAGGYPAISAGETQMRSFLEDYQRLFTYRAPNGQWQLRFCALIYVNPAAAVKGWITMPDGSRYYGLVGVNDGFGNPIQYVTKGYFNQMVPCFVSVVYAGPGQTFNVYSNN
ncbi:MAG TPA: hypothetical protein VMG59_10860 [Phycisphaerae bacterium]|nr:hypothetical protein [Phycisphaerae bacterium]